MSHISGGLVSCSPLFWALLNLLSLTGLKFFLQVFKLIKHWYWWRHLSCSFKYFIRTNQNVCSINILSGPFITYVYLNLKGKRWGNFYYSFVTKFTRNIIEFNRYTYLTELNLDLSRKSEKLTFCFVMNL